MSSHNWGEALGLPVIMIIIEWVRAISNHRHAEWTVNCYPGCSKIFYNLVKKYNYLSTVHIMKSPKASPKYFVQNLLPVSDWKVIWTLYPIVVRVGRVEGSVFKSNKIPGLGMWKINHHFSARLLSKNWLKWIMKMVINTCTQTRTIWEWNHL